MSDKGHTGAGASDEPRDGIDEGDAGGSAAGATVGRAELDTSGSEEARGPDQFDAFGRELAKMMRQANESAELIRAEAVAEAERTIARAEAAAEARLRAAEEADLHRQELDAELEAAQAEARASLEEARSLLQHAQELDRVTRANTAVMLESAATRRAAVDEASTSLAALLAEVDLTMAGWQANAVITRDAFAQVSSGLHEVIDQPDPDLLVEGTAPMSDLVAAVHAEVTIDLREPDPRHSDLPAPPALADLPAPPAPPDQPAPPTRLGAHAEVAPSEDVSTGPGDIEAAHVEAGDDDEALRATVRTTVSRAVDTFMTDISSAR